MDQPTIDVLGVYRLKVTDDLFREQFEILYPPDLSQNDRVVAESQIREQLESTVLIKAVVRNRDDHFDVGDFTQPREDVSQDSWRTTGCSGQLAAEPERQAGCR